MTLIRLSRLASFTDCLNCILILFYNDLKISIVFRHYLRKKKFKLNTFVLINNGC